MSNLLKFINYIFASLLFVAAIFLAYLALPYFGNRALIVQSGSMSPKIKTGDLVVINTQTTIASPQNIPVATYHEGEVIAFKDVKNPNVLITHRIVGKEIKDNKVFYKTKGDANTSPDSKLVAQDRIVGKSKIVIPSLGKIFSLAKDKRGFFLLVIIPALLVILAETTNLIKEVAKIQRARRFLREDPTSTIEKQKLIGPLGLRITLPFIIGMLFFHNTYAFFSNNASSVNNTFVAAQTFPTPTPGPNAGDVVINEIMWMGTQGDAADEWIELRNMTLSTIDLSNWVVDNLGSGATNNIVIPSGKSISPSGFFMIANDTKATGNHDVDPDHVTNISLLNPGEQLRLRTSAGGTIIDTADNDGSGWFAGVDPGGQNPEKSMERNNVPGDGTLAGSWHTATSATNMDVGAREIATPKAVNSSP